jgi:hypothetical protein
VVQRNTPDFRIPKRQGFGQDRRIVTSTKRPFYGTVTPGDCAAKKKFFDYKCGVAAAQRGIGIGRIDKQ